jgi:hypothetical protein
MVRPNGSVMASDSEARALDARGLDNGPVIQYAQLLRQPP